ncbi:hypothetical protein KAU19_04475, partial [Candidatus Parcubacteria bacterium]|nr:hypothetical protein [Candidatus Parcubacteria bacterium]
IIEYLSKSIAKNNVAGAYIFCGPDNLGKTTVANYFAKSLVCQNNIKGSGLLPCGKCQVCEQVEKGIHGDIHLIKKDKDKKNISIEQIRDFIRILGMASFLNSYKIGIIKHAEYLSIEAANALLKTLEEPKVKVVIILVVSNTDSLPQTIVSRSQILKFKPIKADIIYDYLVKEYQCKRSLAKDLSHLCMGRPALAVKFLQDKEFFNNYLDRAQAFLQFCRQDINERIFSVEKLIGVKPIGQESARLAARILEIWQGLARDLLLLKLDQNNLVQHLLLIEQLDKIKTRFNKSGLLNLDRSLCQAREYLAANVSPKLVLENVVVNI